MVSHSKLNVILANETWTIFTHVLIYLLRTFWFFVQVEKKSRANLFFFNFPPICWNCVQNEMWRRVQSILLLNKKSVRKFISKMNTFFIVLRYWRDTNSNRRGPNQTKSILQKRKTATKTNWGLNNFQAIINQGIIAVRKKRDVCVFLKVREMRKKDSNEWLALYIISAGRCAFCICV